MGSCSRIKLFCADERRLKCALFDHNNPQTFTQFQFGYPRVYLGWRLFWALYHTVWLILTGVYSYQWAGPDTEQQIKWFIYLTHWAYFTLTMATITDACAVFYIYLKRKDILIGSCYMLPWYMKAAWCITTMASVVSIAMSIAYWGLLTVRQRTAVDIETHALNVVYVLLNLAVTGMPIRLLHFWYSILYAVVYVIFTLVYYLADGTNALDKPYVYDVIDWREPGTTVGYSVALGVVLTTILHLALYGIHVLKLWIYYNVKCCGASEEYSVENAKDKQMRESTGL